jgi:hypothetical protein
LDAAQFSEECGTTKIRCGFNLDDAEVMIIFSGGDKSDATCEKLPVGTVLAIKLRFRHLQPFEDFRLRNEKAIVFDPSTPPKSGYKAYYYSKAGLIVSTFKGQVAEVVYIATQEDLQRCAVYYDNPKAFVAVGLTY